CICVEPSIETDVGDVIPRSAGHREIVTEMPAALIVINCVTETVLRGVAKLALFREEKHMATVRTQYLPAKRRLLIEAKAAVEAAELVVLVYKATVCREETDKRI